MLSHELVRMAITRSGMTDEEAAARLRISDKYLRDICTGRVAVSAYVAVRLQRCFGMNAQLLLMQQVMAALSTAWKELEELEEA